MKWSADADATLRRMANEGRDDAAIAQVVRRTQFAVAARRRTLGIQASPSVPWSPAEDATLRRRTAAGATDATVGREIGRTAYAVAQRRKLLALPKRTRWTAAEDAMSESMPTEEVAAATGRSRKAVWTRRSLLRKREDSEGRAIAEARSRRLRGGVFGSEAQR